MKCPECKGRGHFLMPMSTPTCEACGGTGCRKSDEELIGEIVSIAAGLDVSAPKPDTVPWSPNGNPNPWVFGMDFNTAGLSGLAGWLPEGRRPHGPLLGRTRGGKTAALRAEQMARDEERLREVVAGHAAQGCSPGGHVVAAEWDHARRCLLVRVKSGSPPRPRSLHGFKCTSILTGRGEVENTVYVPSEYIATHFRTVYERDPHRFGHRLAAIEVREGDEWRVARTFEETDD